MAKLLGVMSPSSAVANVVIVPSGAMDLMASSAQLQNPSGSIGLNGNRNKPTYVGVSHEHHAIGDLDAVGFKIEGGNRNPHHWVISRLRPRDMS